MPRPRRECPSSGEPKSSASLTARGFPPVITVAADRNEVWPRAGRVPPRRETSRRTRRTLGQPFRIPSVRLGSRPRSPWNAVWPCGSGLPSGSRRISYRSNRSPPSVVSVGHSGSRSRERLMYFCPTIVRVVGDCRTSEDGDLTKLPRLSNATIGYCSRSAYPAGRTSVLGFEPSETSDLDERWDGSIP